MGELISLDMSEVNPSAYGMTDSEIIQKLAKIIQTSPNCRVGFLTLTPYILANANPQVEG